MSRGLSQPIAKSPCYRHVQSRVMQPRRNTGRGSRVWDVFGVVRGRPANGHALVSQPFARSDRQDTPASTAVMTRFTTISPVCAIQYP
jgi:hypothetical protein